MSETAAQLVPPFAPHVLIPFAVASSEEAQATLRSLNLPNLSLLLSRLTLVDADEGADDTFSPPHERAYAKALGLVTEESLVDGYLPWAAKAALDLNLKGHSAWGWVSLCHYFVGTGSMTLENPALLRISEGESQQLFAEMSPYFAEDGLTLHHVEPGRWLVCGEPLQNIPTASLDRVIGRNLDAWQPEGNAAAKLRRLQNEMQMLLYTHTVNEARSQVVGDARLPLINSIWLHGTGELGAEKATKPEEVINNFSINRSLQTPALHEDWPAWAQAWQNLDATLMADLLQQLQRSEAVKLTLCGERGFQTYAFQPKTGWNGIKTRFRGIFGLQPAYLLIAKL